MSNLHSHDGINYHASHDHSHSNLHSHDGINFHAGHDTPFSAAEHGHSHEILDGPGSYLGREMPIVEGRNWEDRAFTVGIGGYVSLFSLLPFPTNPANPMTIAPSAPAKQP